MADRRTNILQSSGFKALADLRTKKQERKHQAAEELRKVGNKFYQTADGSFYNPLTGESRTDPNVAESRRSRNKEEQDLKKELINLRHTRNLELEGVKGRRMPASVRKEYSKLHGLVEGAQATADQGQRLTEAGKEYVNPIMDTIASILPAQAEQGLFSMALDPDEKSQRQLMSRFIAGIRKSELGAALTQFEAKMGANWDPMAAGISQKDANMRFQALVDEMARAKDALALGYDVPGAPQTPPAGNSADAPIKGQDAGAMTLEEKYHALQEHKRQQGMQ